MSLRNVHRCAAAVAGAIVATATYAAAEISDPPRDAESITNEAK